MLRQHAEATANLRTVRGTAAKKGIRIAGAKRTDDPT
jgi:hypothetical protein